MPAKDTFEGGKPIESSVGLFFTRKKFSKEFVNSSGLRIPVQDRKQSFLCYFPTVTMPDGTSWQTDPRKWRTRLGSIARGNYMTASIYRVEDASLTIEVTIAEQWSKTEVRGPEGRLYGVMESGQYCLRSESGNIVARGGRSWRDSDHEKGIAESFWYDGHSCGDWWPSLMLVITQIGDPMRNSAESAGG